MIKRFISCTENMLLKYVYPKSIYCIVCGAIIDDTRHYSLCDDCMTTLNWSNQEDNGFIRTFCETAGPEIQDVYTCFIYGNREKIPILALKHRGETYISRELGEIMYDRIMLEVKRHYGELFFDIIIPVPLHYKRMRQRGYNQAELLAKEVSTRIGVPMEKDAIIRIRNTDKTKNMSKEERADNIKNAFSLKNAARINKKSILLIDDVYTTGATAKEVAKTLKQGGAKNIYLLTAAAGSPRKIMLKN